MPLYRAWTCYRCGEEVLYFMPASGKGYLTLDPKTKDPHKCPVLEALEDKDSKHG